ncbi:hypothetical protein DFP94_101990 [Fontibacillus phaseoli]|uniref:Uncharacterized protein n=1 Tax=Fontibacillus phaseoli TaxID=1416533 RepID=A0A369BPS9_9BACL|nr:hypothetical protein DFP94_101990 [Fontibacillus phaseoli]
MKKGLWLGSFIFIFLLSSMSVSAHPGRTDSKGGHYLSNLSELAFCK